jgi:PIN domain nuclease of toxin-antitoxin system
MEWLNQLQGQTVGLDTAPLISFIQQDPKHIDKLRAFFTAMSKGDFEVVTSAITLSEVLVHPYKLGQIKLAQEYRDILLNQNHLTMFAVSSAIAEQTAQLRTCLKSYEIAYRAFVLGSNRRTIKCTIAP